MIKKYDTIQVISKNLFPHTVTSEECLFILGTCLPGLGTLFHTCIFFLGASAEISTASMRPAEYSFHYKIHLYTIGSSGCSMKFLIVVSSSTRIFVIRVNKTKIEYLLLKRLHRY